MTKDEALKAMKQGKRIRHISFTKEEWMRLSGINIEFEDGCKCHPREFWAFRDSPSWDYDWSIVGDTDE